MGPGAEGKGAKAGFPTKESKYSWCKDLEGPVMDQYGVTSIEGRKF